MNSRRTATIGVLGALLSGVLFGQQSSGAPQGRSLVDFEPLNTVSVVRDKSTPVQFTFHVTNGYHINSNKPTTPELIPTTLGFMPPPDLVIAKVQYPAGQLTSFPFDPTEKLSVYSGVVVIKAVIIPDRHAPSGTYTIHGEFKYQACDNNACYPPKKLPVQFDVKLAKAARSTKPRPTRQSPNIH